MGKSKFKKGIKNYTTIIQLNGQDHFLGGKLTCGSRLEILKCVEKNDEPVRWRSSVKIQGIRQTLGPTSEQTVQELCQRPKT